MAECGFLFLLRLGNCTPTPCYCGLPEEPISFPIGQKDLAFVSLPLSIELENVRGCVNEHSKVVWIKLNLHLQNIVAF